MLTRVKKNFSYLFGAELASRALTLIFTIYLARLYGPEQFGVYGLALSLGGLFDIIFNMGLATVFMQRVAEDADKMKDELSVFLPLRLLLSAGLFVSFAAVALLMQKEEATWYALTVTAIYFSLSSLTTFLWACFDAKQRMQFTAAAKLLMYIVIFAVGMMYVLWHAPVFQIMNAYVFGALAALIFTASLIHARFVRISFSWNPAEWKKILAAGWPITLSGAFIFVYTSLDTILISIFKGEYFVGQYQMSYKIIGTIFILAALINQAYFPSLIGQIKKSAARLQKIFDANLQSIFFWSVPLTVGGLMLSDRIILFIFGEEYMAGATAFKILMLNCVIFFASSALMNILYAFKKQRKVMTVFFFGAISNVLLNLMVIPAYGIEGAAATTIAAELTVLLGMYLQARRVVKIKFLSSLLKPVIAAAAMAAALSFIYLEGLILTVALGALVYFGMYFALNQLKRLHLP